MYPGGFIVSRMPVPARLSGIFKVLSIIIKSCRFIYVSADRADVFACAFVKDEIVRSRPG